VAVGTLAVYIGLPLSLASAGFFAFVYATGLRIAMPSVDKLD
jgi:hypothetical protein